MDGMSFMTTEYGLSTCQCVQMNKFIFKNPICERVPESTLNRAMIKLTLGLAPSADTLPNNYLNIINSACQEMEGSQQDVTTPTVLVYLQTMIL